jgi:hypothetical protein
MAKQRNEKEERTQRTKGYQVTLKDSTVQLLDCSMILLVAVLFVIAGCAACQNMKSIPSVIPPCPTPTHAMVNEAASGSLDDSPAIEEYLGRIELYCDAISELRK